MPQDQWSLERERQYEASYDDRGDNEDTAEEIAPAVKEGMAGNGDTRGASVTSLEDASSRRSGGGSHSGGGGRTYRELYREAKSRGLEGRSKMSKRELEEALDH